MAEWREMSLLTLNSFSSHLMLGTELLAGVGDIEEVLTIEKESKPLPFCGYVGQDSALSEAAVPEGAMILGLHLGPSHAP